MVFNSFEFAVFLGIVLGVYHVAIPASAVRGRRLWILGASYFFYGSWSPPFTLLLLFSTLLDYSVGRLLERSEGRAVRRLLLGVSLLGNLGLLGYFKYGGLLTETLASMTPASWWHGGGPHLDVLLPVGISFYTFQTLSYAIDVYRREQPACRSLLDFSLYVSFFPQLVAGPIVRARDFLPQLGSKHVVHARHLEENVAAIAIGLVKKVVLADNLAPYVDQVFAAPGAAHAGDALLAIYAFAFQIYFDFSGYSDIAIGTAGLLGFRLPENFDRPYVSASPREFWRRWHISLSTWLRDYLYISLGGGLRREQRVRANLLITMLLGGLWHGASWTFLLWGGYHGALLVAQRVWTARFPGTYRPPRFLLQMATFHLVCLGWLLFRAADFATVGSMLAALGRPGLTLQVDVLRTGMLVLLAAGLHAIDEPLCLRRRIAGLAPAAQGLAYAGLALLLYVFGVSSQQFIYFQF